MLPQFVIPKMSLTNYHARYFAHVLTKRSGSDDVDKLASVLSDAQVDLNPHQIEAALFAFRSPLSKGAILADEVGLGKTIEAGILLAQHWAERRRALVVICPANLRKQWSQELLDKFFLPSVILEAKTFNEAIRAGNLNPFQQGKIIICSFQFARSKEPYVRSTPWNLVVIDEAHRLRNVYKPGNKVANSIKNAVSGFQKVLLTATPLQNSLLELYGLVSIVDEFTFGDLRSFRAQFGRLAGKADFDALKQRLRPVCQRTLRRQVLAYVPYTNRHAMVQEFHPSAAEQQLYEVVSDYLMGDKLYALPASQRQLMTLILRKLLASSTYAISDTLLGLATKLETAEAFQKQAEEVPASIAEDFETLPEVQDEWIDEDEGSESESDEARKKSPERLSPEQLAELRAEKDKLHHFHALAKAIQTNSKGDALLTALQRGFEAARTARMADGTGALQQKAIIFTESRRTQEYLFNLLQKTEFLGKVVLFNGTNTDPQSQSIYQAWMKQHAGTDRITGSPTADKRAALVEHFRDTASIMIATEAAAEGINLQFCNLVVNYDMPWNPQRIEQRIGRCHRYGQKFDVVVVNFLNRANAADVRVYQLLAEKFKLFDGVFGASDEVIGVVESGVDFEKRIVAIYQKCRTTEQIELQFDQLQQELESQISQARSDASEQLLNNFDQEVIERVRVTSGQSLGRFQDLLWRLTAFYLAPYARFDTPGHSFHLERDPFPVFVESPQPVNPGPYRMGKNVEDANTYRVGHPLAQQVLRSCCVLPTPKVDLEFDLSGSGKRIAVLESLPARSGWLSCSRFTLSGFETEDHILLAGIMDDGQPLEPSACKRLFDLGAVSGQSLLLEAPETLAVELEKEQQRVLADLESRNGKWLDSEIEKLDRWTEDLKFGLEQEIKDLDKEIREVRRESVASTGLRHKLEHQRRLRDLTSTRNQRRKDLFIAQDEVEARRETLIADIEGKLKQKQELVPLFTIRWRLT
ncbi:SNF2-related protein [Granulicella mallensis]|uniref:Superfamily II DNA/RNA helicase n=1 Tax=Granulicella mallensis TaxID=940614 RepID=A0A7W8E848_9BACT|nr:SNF2-related protein [Granulicella mallensis]MBB5062462.1 superfamily II DNA/RNA helicase [Granulicella mallensis]